MKLFKFMVFKLLKSIFRIKKVVIGHFSHALRQSSPQVCIIPPGRGKLPASLTAFFRNLLPHQKGESKDTLKIVILRICPAQYCIVVPCP